MQKKNEIILWPVYFDYKKTRSEGRRVPKKLAVRSPRLEDILAVVERMNLQCKVYPDAAHPRFPWIKTSFMSVYKKESKNRLIKKIAMNLRS